MNSYEIRALAKKHTPLIEAICNLFHAKQISPEEGEALLLWTVGLTAGVRGANIHSASFIEPLALAYHMVQVQERFALILPVEDKE